MKRTLVVLLLIAMLIPTLPLQAATSIGSADATIGAKLWNALRGITGIVIPKKKEKMMARFASAQEFDRYIAGLIKKQTQRQLTQYKSTGFSSGLSFQSLNNVATESSLADASSNTITNNQEQGVDEGDIVKAYKDYLVILRRGRIFTVRTGDARATTLTPIARINAYPEGMTPANWYDELLIDGNRVIVIGYSYQKSATEIGLFTIHDDGSLTHASTYFLDSNDYYSSRNYASRLVDGKLVFYMPYYFMNTYYGPTDRPDVHLPAMKKWISGDKTEERSILSKVDIYKPLQEDLAPALHTVVMCDLQRGLDCRAKAILGPASRNFYVSPNAVYLWMTGAAPYTALEESTPKCLGITGTKCALRPEPKPNAYVYRLDLRDGGATVLRTDGSPIDQFSFKEADGYLNVLVRSEGRGDAMWRSEVSTGDLALFRTPLSAFSADAKTVSKNTFTSLPTPDGYGLQNRFVGDSVLYGSGGAWWSNGESSTLYVKNFTTNDATTKLDLSHSVDRIEVMGDGAVVIGAAKDALQFSSVTLDRTPAIADVFTLNNATQGELRSHGFFYSPQNDGTGIIGLPVRKQGNAIESYMTDSAAVTFLQVAQDKHFRSIGELWSENSETNRDDNCVASCVDWYGNARPIFYHGRIFALMGYELIEGNVSDRGIKETVHTDYFHTMR